MKHKVLTSVGRFLMKFSKLRICIIDDEDIYFNPNMLEIANNAGFYSIDRFSNVDNKLFQILQKRPYDIVILDVKGVSDEPVAKDGLHIASILYKTTNSYIVLTSAHQFHLNNKMTDVDYIIEERLLTAADFVDTLIDIANDCLSTKIVFYKNIIFRVGFMMVKKAAV